MDNLENYKKNITSQWGEDGITEEIFNRIGTGVNNPFCIEFGAWDGKHLSNVWNLWHNKGWGALLIEGESSRCKVLKKATQSFPKVSQYTAWVKNEGENSLDEIISRVCPNTSIDLLSIDIDSDDYYIFESLKVKSRVIIIEYNPTIPPHINLVQKLGEYIGSSALAISELAKSKGYKLVAITQTNLFFVHETEFDKLKIEEPKLKDIFPLDNLTYIISSMDGVTFATKSPTYTNAKKPNKKLRYFNQPNGVFPIIISRNKKLSTRIKNVLKRYFKS